MALAQSQKDAMRKLERTLLVSALAAVLLLDSECLPAMSKISKASAR